MEAKTSFVKSRSSKSAKTVRSEYTPRNKKSRSNAEFQPLVMKKRGVYVEKTEKLETGPEKYHVQERPKAPPRPRPGDKKFLASVLTILSQSTTGTQYPDSNDPTTKREGRRIVRRNITLSVDNKDRKKPKYRSKALNNEVDKEVNQEKVLVLQSQKDVIQTPSIYSENDSLNWSNVPSLVKRTQHKNNEAVERKVKEAAIDLTKEILNGRKEILENCKEMASSRKSRKDKRVRIDEPKTLVADSEITPSNKEGDGKLLNFFVDLLETTISVYNVKAEYDKTATPPSELSSTKIPEIDESVAEKLNIQNETEKSAPNSEKLSHFYCLQDAEYVRNVPLPPKIQEVVSKSPRKKMFSGDSFSFTRKPKLRADSVTEPKKLFSRKENKKTLLNLFKEQLRIDDDAFEEPQNLYQALKLIAYNKRRCQKTIYFDETFKKRSKDYGFPECMFKRRKVISTSTKLTNNKDKKSPNVPSLSLQSELSKRRPKSEYTADFEDQSHHSLEVYGYDYETPSVRKGKLNPQKEILFTYHSSPSLSQHSFGSMDTMDYFETDSISFIQ